MEELKLTPQELAEFEEFRREKARREAEQKKRQDREAYRQLIDELIESKFPTLRQVSNNLAQVKASVMDDFRKAIAMKTEIYESKGEQRSHTFSNSKGDKRITLGVYTTDSYRDTVNEGIAIVKEAITGLVKDDDTKILVDAILKLLSKDQNGNLKASRILQLRQLAEKIGNSRLLDGVKIIEESYQPAVSKTYVRAEYKDENGQWVNIPLGMTEAL